MASTTLPNFHSFARSFERVIRIGRGRAEQLAQCDWCSPVSTWGACDCGYPCPSPATVQDLEDDNSYCLHHFLRRGCVR